MSNDRRNLRARKLLDPTWHALRDALDKLYAEIETDATTRGISVAVDNADGTRLTYMVDLRSGDLRRLLLTDRDTLLDAIKASTIEASEREPR